MGDRTESKIDEIATHFPALKLVERRANGETVWDGWVKPIVSSNDYGNLLDDLDKDRPVRVLTGSVVGLTHSPKCTVVHTQNPLAEAIGNPIRLFHIRVTDFNDQKMPLCQVLEPEITLRTRNHTRGLDGMCLYPPWRFPWSSDSSIAELLKHAMVWLVKWDVFDRGKKWIGTETPHTYEYLLANVRPSDSCTCFSGDEYGVCCRPFHELAVNLGYAVIAGRRREFHRLFPPHQVRIPQTLLNFLGGKKYLTLGKVSGA